MYTLRDYRKPLMLKFKGKEGLRAYIKLLKMPAVKYDAKKEAQKALADLRKQGAKI